MSGENGGRRSDVVWRISMLLVAVAFTILYAVGTRYSYVPPSGVSDASGTLLRVDQWTGDVEMHSMTNNLLRWSRLP